MYDATRSHDMPSNIVRNDVCATHGFVDTSGRIGTCARDSFRLLAAHCLAACSCSRREDVVCGGAVTCARCGTVSAASGGDSGRGGLLLQSIGVSDKGVAISGSMLLWLDASASYTSKCLTRPVFWQVAGTPVKKRWLVTSLTWEKYHSVLLMCCGKFDPNKACWFRRCDRMLLPALAPPVMAPH